MFIVMFFWTRHFKPPEATCERRQRYFYICRNKVKGKPLNRSDVSSEESQSGNHGWIDRSSIKVALGMGTSAFGTSSSCLPVPGTIPR